MEYPFFPIPAEGETIYSVFCRYHERSGLPKSTILGAFSPWKMIDHLLSPVPGYLEKLAAALPIGHPWKNAQHTMQSHSAFPYYTFFDPPDQRVAALRSLLENSCALGLATGLGLTMYRCGATSKHPRFCVQCKDVDETSLGFPYLHREHQLPAVAVCWKHGTPLCNGCQVCGQYPIRNRPLSIVGHCYCANGQVPLSVKNTPGNPKVLNWLALESARMILGPGTNCEVVRAELRHQAVEQGLCRGVHPCYADIASAMEERFGADTTSNILDTQLGPMDDRALGSASSSIQRNKEVPLLCLSFSWDCLISPWMNSAKSIRERCGLFNS